MDTLNAYRQIIRQVLAPIEHRRYAHGNFQNEAVFDRDRDRYLIMSAGWDGYRRVHGCLIHLDIIDGKVWVQRDGTEDGIALELVQAGIPKEDIVLAFHEPAARKHTGFAVA